MEVSLNQQSSHGIMDELAAASSCSDASTGTTLSDFADDATSSSSSTISPSSSDERLAVGPLYEMSTLMAQLPFKRGLSKFFEGKSQSFTSLSNVRCLEDLAKPENPSKKKLKTCKSYGGDLDSQHKSKTQKSSFKPISKSATRGPRSSHSTKRVTFFSNKPPVPPQRAGSLSNQTPLFA